MKIAIGEASPWYLHMPKASERIKHYIPEAKLIAILRDPVERAYSQFGMHLGFNYEPIADFTQAIRAESEPIRSNWSPRWYYKQRGFYYAQLKRYFDLFERNQIRVYLYEEFQTNSLNILQDIFRFLGVDDTFMPNTDRKHNVTLMPKNKALYQFLTQSNPMKSILQSLLATPTAPAVCTQTQKAELGQEASVATRKYDGNLSKNIVKIFLKLQDLIQRDISHWLES